MIEARLMIEVLGKPEEILVKTLENVVNEINSRYKVSHKEILKPKKIKGSDMHCAVLEVEVKFKKYDDLFSCILDYGPTFIEILEPDEILIKSSELQDTISDLIGKIHDMSKLIQALSVENMMLKQQKK